MKRIKIIAFLLFLFLLANTVTTTYSRYISASTGDITTQFARWQIAVNNTNINQNYNTSITYTPVVDTNSNVNNGKIAPGSTGYFDIQIDATKVDVSFTYTIGITSGLNTDIPDLKITDYAIFNAGVANPTITKISYSGQTITNTMIYDNNTANFQFQAFVIRVFFVWDDTVSTQTMDNSQDTAVGKMAANNETLTNDYIISLHFNQYLAH